MKKYMIVRGLACVSATLLLAQTQERQIERAPPPAKNVKPVFIPLNVSTGVWQMTETITWTGLPPQVAAAMSGQPTITYKSCVRPKNQSSNPGAEVYLDGSDFQRH